MRTLLVGAGHRLLGDERTIRLHAYPNGDVLIRTGAPSDEAARDEERPVRTGLALAGLRVPEAQAKKHEDAAYAEVSYLAYVVLAGPAAPAWLAQLEALGVSLIRYQPFHCYLARGTGRAFAAAVGLGFVADVIDLTAELKPAPRVAESGTTRVRVLVAVGGGDGKKLAGGAGDGAPLPGIERVIGEPQVLDGTLTLEAEVTAEELAALLRDPRVLAVEEHAERRLEDERANLILAGEYSAAGRPQGSYLAWLEQHGVDGRGVMIGIVDGGVDAGHPAFDGRISDRSPGRKSWHGTFVAGHAAGAYLDERDPEQFIYGLGVAPGAEILAQDNTRTPQALCLETVTSVGPRGARGLVQNNSWGQGQKQPMDYGSLEAAYDSLVRNAEPGGDKPKPLVVCFSSGNSGPAGLTRPKSAKNIIVTGNSENYRPQTGRGDSDNIDDVYTGPGASSHGNCGDLRTRPDLVAPGEWTASANYDSHAPQKEFISERLTWGGGSSAASPKTAGACALLIQWWGRRFEGRVPSPAMLRALLVNGAVDTGAGGPVPNKLQGWGRLHLGNVMGKDRVHVLIDQDVMLRHMGDRHTVRVRVVDPSRPVRVTLAYTDPPGAHNSGTAEVPAIVNQLALRVIADGAEYHGNQLAEGWSVAGPHRDPERRGGDNLQNVFLRGLKAGAELAVEVEALNITTNCLALRPIEPQQDFALVVSNAALLPAKPEPKPEPKPERKPRPEPEPRPQPEPQRSVSADDWWSDGGPTTETTRSEEAVRPELGPHPAARGFAMKRDLGILPARPAPSPSVKLQRLAPAVRADVLRAFARPNVRIASIMAVRVVEPATARVRIVDEGDHRLWVDPTGDTVLFARRIPRVLGLQLTVLRQVGADGSIAISGGRATLTLDVAVPLDVAELGILQPRWQAAIEQAGLGGGARRFRPLGSRMATASLELPAADAVRQQWSASDPLETVTIVAELTAFGAAAWMEALERGEAGAIAGTCAVRATFAQQDGLALRAGEHVIGGGLGALLAGRGAECVSVVNPLQSLAVPVCVDRCEHVESVTVTLTPSEGAGPETFTCGPEGMSRTLKLTSAAPGAVTIPWTAEVRFQPVGWPARRLAGTLSVAAGDWVLMLAPGTLVRRLTVAMSLLDARRQPIAALPDGAEPESGEHAVVVMHLAEPAPGEAPPPAATLRVTGLQVYDLPVPAASEPVLSIFSFRSAQPGMATFTARAEDNLVVVLVDVDGGVQVSTDQTPVEESSVAGGLLAQLHQLTPH